MVEAKSNNLTDAEADLYDRQIRLWGLDAQKRLRAATVLLIGLQGIGAEFCKNIVLAGIKSITLLDDKNGTEDDSWCQFLIPREKLEENRAESSLERAQRLNPMVDIVVDTENIDKKPDEFFTGFSVVVATDCNLTQLTRINKVCHKANVKFFCADVMGFYGYVFADLQKHQFVDEKSVIKKEKNEVVDKDHGAKKQKLEITPNLAKLQPREKTKVVNVTFKGTLHYPTLEESLKVGPEIKSKPARVLSDWTSFFLLKILFKFRDEKERYPQAETREEDLELLKEIRDSEMENIGLSKDTVYDEYLSLVFSQISPVCAIVGGVLAQEVIKTVSQKGKPHFNWFFFNPVKNHGIVLKAD